MDISKYIVWYNWGIGHITEYDEEDNDYFVEAYYREYSDWYDVEFIEKNSKPAKWYHIIKYYLNKLLYKF